jgi:hypothetical protein
MTDDDYKYIYTKHRVYRLSKDAKGIPIEEFYPGATMPAFLKGAVVYDTPRGPIIAHQESSERAGTATDHRDEGAAPQHATGDATRARPAAVADGPGPPPKLKEATLARQDNQMGYFRRDAPAQSAVADPWQAVKITCQEAFAMRPQKTGIEDPATAARAVRVLLMRHFPEGPGMAAVAQKAAKHYNAALDKSLQNGGVCRPKMTVLARRWGVFCHDLGNAEREHYEAGYRPAIVDPYAIDFSQVRLGPRDRRAALNDQSVHRGRGDDVER